MIYLITPDSSHSEILSAFFTKREKEYTIITEDEIAQISKEDTVFIDETVVLFNTPILTQLPTKQISFFMPHPEKDDAVLIHRKKRIDTMTGMRRHRPALQKRTMQTMVYKGHILLDVPPRTLPARRAGLWKRPERLVSSLISHLSTQFESHPKISLVGAESGEILERIVPLFGKRATIEQDKTYIAGTPVLTWSTYRFYHFLQQGLHPLPITKSLARSFFMPSRRKGIADMLTSGGYTQEMMNLLDGAIEEITFSV